MRKNVSLFLYMCVYGLCLLFGFTNQIDPLLQINMPRHMITSSLLLLSLLITPTLTQNTVSLFSWPEYQLLRSCAQICIWGYSGSVADTIGCPSPWYDECVCNAQYEASAASHVASCVNSLCTVGAKVDGPTAVAAYTDYCYSAGFTTSGQAAPTMSLDLHTVSLFQDSGYKLLRNCAQACIWGYSGSVADFIGCPSPWYNSCVCNINQQPFAAKNVGNCITTRCTGTQDVSTAMEVYTNYCSGAGYELGVATATTVTGGNPLTPTIFPGNPTPTLTSPTQPANTHSGSGSGSGQPLLTTGGIIGVAISAGCSVLGLIFGIAFKIWKHNQAKKSQRTRPPHIY